MDKENSKPKPHPYAHWIKLWADGVPIEYKACGKWIKVIDFNLTTQPDIEYRIKPETEEPWKPKEGGTYLYVNSCGEVFEKVWESSEVDKKHYENGNCFHHQDDAEATAKRVKRAMKNLYAVSDKKAHDLECELYDKIDRLTKHPEIDGKPLTEGEKELIKAIRNTGITSVYEYGQTMLVKKKVDGTLSGTVVHIAFVTGATVSKDESVVNALRKIQEEVEGAETR